VSTKTAAAPRAIDPDYLYTQETLAPLCGLSARRLKRMMDEGRIGYVLTGAQRGRAIEGQQFLDWKASRRVAAEDNA
jgi:hypothetical protein